VFFTAIPSFSAAAIRVKLAWPVASIPVIIANMNFFSGTVRLFPAFYTIRMISFFTFY